jgi:dihydropteroate synthase
MGVLNVTPDSFSDGGAWLDPDAAIAHANELVREGADIIDVGGESTRPGAERVAPEEELRRIRPVVTALATDGVTVSIDTTRPDVASAALAAGAVLVNDVSGGADSRLLDVVAESDAAYVVMHSRGTSADMQSRAVYDDVVRDVCDELRRSVAAAVEAGVAESRIAIDPGLGFAKTSAHNLRLLARLRDLTSLGRPILVGASRKSFIGAVLADRPVDDRDDATLALTAHAVACGAWAVRVHSVRPSADAVRMLAAVAEAGR